MCPSQQCSPIWTIPAIRHTNISPKTRQLQLHLSFFSSLLSSVFFVESHCPVLLRQSLVWHLLVLPIEHRFPLLMDFDWHLNLQWPFFLHLKHTLSNISVVSQCHDIFLWLWTSALFAHLVIAQSKFELYKRHLLVTLNHNREKCLVAS